MRSLLPFFGGSRRRFDSLSAQEILALAISSEEEDGRVYAVYQVVHFAGSAAGDPEIAFSVAVSSR